MKTKKVVLGAEIELSDSPTLEGRRADYRALADHFRILAKTCYSHPARNRDYAAKCAAYEAAAQHTR